MWTKEHIPIWSEMDMLATIDKVFYIYECQYLFSTNQTSKAHIYQVTIAKALRYT